MIEFVKIMIKPKEILKNSILYAGFLLLSVLFIFSVKFPLNRPQELTLAVFFIRILPAAGFTALTLFLPAFYSKNNSNPFLKLLISIPVLSLVTALFLYQPQTVSLDTYNRIAQMDDDIFYVSDDKIIFTINVDKNYINKGILFDKTVYSSDIEERNSFSVINKRRYAMQAPGYSAFTISEETNIFREKRADRFSVFFNSFISSASVMAEEIQSVRFKGHVHFFMNLSVIVFFISMISAFFAKTPWPLTNYLFSQGAVMLFLWLNIYLKRIPLGKNIEQYLPLDFYLSVYLLLSVIMLVRILLSSRRASGRQR